MSTCTIGREVNFMVSDLLTKQTSLCREAKKLLDPVPARKQKATYRANVQGKDYLVTSYKGAHPMDIQKIIEMREGKSFDELYLPYLLPQDIEFMF